MTANTLPTHTGAVGATPIVAQVNSATLAAKRFVTLSQDYQRAPAPGYPNPNEGAAVATSKTAFPQLILSGTRFQVFSDEAASLVAAGAAAYS
jgi:hypothetical protein